MIRRGHGFSTSFHIDDNRVIELSALVLVVAYLAVHLTVYDVVVHRSGRLTTLT